MARAPAVRALALGMLCAIIAAPPAAGVPKPAEHPQTKASGAATPAASAARQDVAATGGSAVMPRPRPAAAEVQAGEGKAPEAGAAKGSDPFRLAMDALDEGDIEEVIALRPQLTDPIDRKTVDWLLARSGSPKVGSALIAEAMATLGGWPDRELLHMRYELALARENPRPRDLARVFRQILPTSVYVRLILARAHLLLGDEATAAALVRPIWREEVLDVSTEKRTLETFSDLLSEADHWARLDMLLYRERISQAGPLARRLGPTAEAIVAARAAVLRQEKDAGKKLDAVPMQGRKDPTFRLSEIQYLRRQGRVEEAKAKMLAAPRDPEVLIDPGEWWTERRTLSRELLDRGDAQGAYEVAAGHSARSGRDIAEAEFHAGWYALRFLGDAAAAERHFARLAAIATTPVSQARASYWQGRAAEARGDAASAKGFYAAAASHPAAFYGQLARVHLGKRDLGLPPLPAPAEGRAALEKSEPARAARRLIEVGEEKRAAPLFRHLAETLEDDAAVVALADLAEKAGQHRLALQVGKIAAARSDRLAALAFPTAAIPDAARFAPERVEHAMIYAIARQESAFDAGAVSGAGALGMLQLMPGTAKAAADRAGLAYSKARLTTDGAYNTMLGAAHLDHLLEFYNGSYVLTFAAYNAGAGNVRKWIERYGDPREQGVDPIDWIERIPFTETRNYVQRILENLQVYRARLGGDTLGLGWDLVRGGGCVTASTDAAMGC